MVRSGVVRNTLSTDGKGGTQDGRQVPIALQLCVYFQPAVSQKI